VCVGCENVICIRLLGIGCIFAHPTSFVLGIIDDLPPYGPLVCLVSQVGVGCENVVCILLHGIVSIFYILISYPQCGAVCCSVLQCVAVCCSVFFQPGVRVGCENVVCILLLGIVCIFAHPALFLWFIIHNLPPYSPLVCCSTRCV